MAQSGIPCTALFPLGRCVGTPGAIEALGEAGQSYAQFLRLHQAGFWGDMDPDDQAMNADALVHGGRIFSAYRTRLGAKLWVITEADRSATTILCPSEY